MTENHGYHTPPEGTLDWHLLLNENFSRLERDVPVVDAESNRDSYAPYAGTMFIASDTGRRFVGDGTAWSELPYPDGTTSDGDSTTDTSTSTSTMSLPSDVESRADSTLVSPLDYHTETLPRQRGLTPDVVVDSTASESELASAFKGLGSGSFLLVEGDHTITKPLVLSNSEGSIVELNGSITADYGSLGGQQDVETSLVWMADTCSGIEIAGGTWNYDAKNNPYMVDSSGAEIPGTQFVFIASSDDAWLHSMTIQNARHGFVNAKRRTDRTPRRGITIENCRMDWSGERGVYASMYHDDFTLRGCYMTNVASGCLRCRANGNYEGVSNSTVENNVLESVDSNTLNDPGIWLGKNISPAIFGWGFQNNVFRHNVLVSDVVDGSRFWVLGLRGDTDAGNVVSDNYLWAPNEAQDAFAFKSGQENENTITNNTYEDVNNVVVAE